MRDDIVMSTTFWSGVINYVRASAQSAEALRPWDFREEKEQKTVMVFSTSVNGIIDRMMIADELNELTGENNWTIDLDDVDKVLRVVAFPGSRSKIIDVLRSHNFRCEVMV